MNLSGACVKLPEQECLELIPHLPFPGNSHRQQDDIIILIQSDIAAEWVQTLSRQDLAELPISSPSNADKVYLDFLVAWGGLNLGLVTGVFEGTEGTVLISLIELSINTVYPLVVLVKHIKS